MTRRQQIAKRWIESYSVKSGPEEARIKGYVVHVRALLNLLTMYHLEQGVG